MTSINQKFRRTSLGTRVAVIVLTTLAVSLSQVQAQLTPDVGWEATLSNNFHNISGTVTVLDEDTLQFDEFTYDGAGLSVYFYLGVTDSPADLAQGLSIGNDFVGPAFDGSQPAFTVDLPSGSTIDGYHAVSVWCVAVGVSFGSGTFVPPVTVPEPASGALALAPFCLVWRRRRAA